MVMYDLVVVGAGMIGSAAARHASTYPTIKVCLVGPSEPKSRTLDDPRDIFGSYYDEGRITRSCDPDPTWATLAQESIKRYRDIETNSGITFYHEVGTLLAGGEKSDYMNNVKENARQQGITVKKLSNAELNDEFPYLKLADDDVGVCELKHAGHINPRRLIEAQQVICRKQGCSIVDDTVCSIERAVQIDGGYVMNVLTEGGIQIVSRRVLLTTGAYTNFRKLLPKGVEPKQKLYGLTVALMEVDKVHAENLKSMPTVIYRGAGRPDNNKFPRNPDDSSLSYYMLPPIRYPDAPYTIIDRCNWFKVPVACLLLTATIGRDYIKLGYFHGTLPVVLTSNAEVREWFVRGSNKIAEMTSKFTQSLFRGVDWSSWHGDQCVLMETPTHLPYIDTVHSQLGVAIGGNGSAAKSSDEIGRLAADMMLGRWNSELSRDLFKLQFADDKLSYISKPKL